MANDTDRYGTTLKLRGQEFNIAPLTKHQLERLWPKIASIQKALNSYAPGDIAATNLPEVMSDVGEVVLAGLQGGGSPDMTIERVGDVLDIANFVEAFVACLRVSNIKLVPGGKVAALVQASPPTGSESTGT